MGCQLKSPDPLSAGAGKSASVMPEQLCFKQSLGNCSAVELHEHVIFSAAGAMDGMSYEALACSRLTMYQHS